MTNLIWELKGFKAGQLHLLKPFNFWEWLASNLFIQYHLWIKYRDRDEKKGKDDKFTKLLFVEKIILLPQEM